MVVFATQGVHRRPSLKPYRPAVMGSSPESAAIVALAARVARGAAVEQGDLRDAVRWLLARLRERAPGRSVEVRVPPYGAVQCVAGPRHTRGTPPNVIEADAATFLLLGAGTLSFVDAVAAGRVSASGTRADLTPYLPLVMPDA
jgi:hypothetical protein